MFVKPAEGRAVHWPGTRRLLAPEGAEVPADSFWLLCARNGDVAFAKPPVAAAETDHQEPEA